MTDKVKLTVNRRMAEAFEALCEAEAVMVESNGSRTFEDAEERDIWRTVLDAKDRLAWRQFKI